MPKGQGLVKLDEGRFQDCLSREDSYVNLVNGGHIFTVTVNSSNGAYSLSQYSWIVDTTPPTASIDAGPAFTNAVNVTVSIIFSEPCDGNGGFVCSSGGSCDLLVYGAGTVIPSTFKEIQHGMRYSLQVALSKESPTGRATVVLAKGFCTDAAGNPFKRTENSSFVIHFDRAMPSVNLWTAIPESQVDISNEARTIQATNSLTDLKIYLDFSQPVLNTTKELLSVLSVTSGNLTATRRRSSGNRRFGYLLMNISSVAVVTVILQGNSVITRYGAPVSSTSNVTFLFDSERPQVQLSTTSLAQTKSNFVPVVVQFTEPVFLFNPSGVTVSGGNITSFKEVAKNTYALEVYVVNDNVVTIAVPENQTSDIAGNSNLASPILQVRHYTTPAISVALYSLTTAGLLATTFASGALSLSSASLAAGGALSSRTSGSIGADPSRNLLGMASHLQIFALSDWLAVTLPIEYGETTRGLRWLIPHINTPWQKDSQASSSSADFGTNVVTGLEVILQQSTRGRRLGLDNVVGVQEVHSEKLALRPKRMAGRHARQRRGRKHINCAIHSFPNCSTRAVLSNTLFPVGRPGSSNYRRMELINSVRLERRLGDNSTQYGPALGASDYQAYFLNQTSNLQALKSMLNTRKDTGWQDFERNMFWLGVVAGGLVLLHMMTLILLRWRTKTTLRGALTLPRFELFLLMLALPAMSQASAFIIKGGSEAGIIVGVLLLSIPASFLLSVALFLSFAIFMGTLVQYKEIRGEARKNRSSRLSPFELLAGKSCRDKWVRKEGLASTFLPRYGLLFEDRKGPPKLVTVDAENGMNNVRKWIDSTATGIGKMRAVNSDDDSDEVSVSRAHKLLGGARSAYILVDLLRRVTFGIVFGAYPRSDRSWSQVSLVFAFTLVQLLYLVLIKPFRRRGVQLAETTSLLCETGVFAAALALLVQGHPTYLRRGVGVFMLVLLLISFVAQLLNEWYALMKQLLWLSPSQEPSLKQGLKMLALGFILPFTPCKRTKFIPPLPHPRLGPAPITPLSLDPGTPDRAWGSSSVQQGSPLVGLAPEASIPVYDPGSPAFIDPRSIISNREDGEGSVPPSGEIRGEATSQRSERQSWGQWSRQRSMEGKRSKGSSKEGKTEELKMLRELAKASFPRRRKEDESNGEQGDGTPMDISSPIASPSGVSRRLARRRLRASGAAPTMPVDGYSDDSLSDLSSDGDLPNETPPSRPDSLNPGDPGTAAATTSSSRSFDKGSGRGDNLSTGPPLRDAVVVNKPLEER